MLSSKKVFVASLRVFTSLLTFTLDAQYTMETGNAQKEVYRVTMLESVQLRWLASFLGSHESHESLGMRRDGY